MARGWSVLLDLNGSLTKAGVKYSTLWSEDFTGYLFCTGLKKWLDTGNKKHVRPRPEVQAMPRSAAERKLGQGPWPPKCLQRNKAIMGIFDEGCMGMYNAIIP